MSWLKDVRRRKILAALGGDRKWGVGAVGKKQFRAKEGGQARGGEPGGSKTKQINKHHKD